MNERQLRYLKAIAEEGSIQKASFLLSKNPSTLTRMLRNTEKELEVTMFIRTAAGLIPTMEGERILVYAEEVLACLAKLEEWTGRTREWTEHEIRYLLVIREHQNISRAAQELYLAQPSLSQMVMEVEKDLGQPIFVRVKDGVRETGFGTGVLERLEKIQEAGRLLETDLEEFREMKKGEVTFGIPMNLGTYLLPLFLPAFCEKYPGIQVRVRENNTSELERLLLAKKIDFCIMHDYEQQEAVEYEIFSDDPFFLVMPGSMKGQFAFPKDRPLAALDLQKLKDAPFIMVASRQKLRLVVDDILEKVGITPYIRCTTRSMETAKRLVAAGMGVTFLPYSYLTLYSGVEGLESYPLAGELNASWKLVAAYLRKGSLPRSSREFLRMLKECLQQKEWHTGT